MERLYPPKLSSGNLFFIDGTGIENISVETTSPYVGVYSDYINYSNTK